ncbi:MAG: RdgB/HAM1 family non-canonical purine NTP pyrophosphatase [Acidimicrobiales bacterium]
MGGKPRLVIASANPDKVKDLVELLGDRYEVVPRPADAPETIEDADTLEGNAIKKASEIATFTGCDAIADDTGLFVDALGGRPGVYSARYAGENATYAENVAKLLGELDGVEDRRAEFRSVVALIRPDGSGVTGEGSVTGRIIDVGRGANGFGYDPVFEPDEGDGQTFAEMSSAEKHELSHRGRAMISLRMALDHLS